MHLAASLFLGETGHGRRFTGRLPRTPNEARIATVVAASTDDWIQVLKALADDTRLRIVKLLLDGPLRVGEISDALAVSTYNVSKHLRVLREAELVVMEKCGKAKRCLLAPEFRQKLQENENVLNLGCCTFHFDQLPGEPV